MFKCNTFHSTTLIFSYSGFTEPQNKKRILKLWSVGIFCVSEAYLAVPQVNFHLHLAKSRWVAMRGQRGLGFGAPLPWTWHTITNEHMVHNQSNWHQSEALAMKLFSAAAITFDRGLLMRICCISAFEWRGRLWPQPMSVSAPFLVSSPKTFPLPAVEVICFISTVSLLDILWISKCFMTVRTVSFANCYFNKWC